MPRQIQVEIVPCPIQARNSSPPEPSVSASSRIADLVYDVETSRIDRRLKYELIYIGPLTQGGERAKLGLDLILRSQISAACVLAPRILEGSSHKVGAAGSGIDLYHFARQQRI